MSKMPIPLLPTRHPADRGQSLCLAGRSRGLAARGILLAPLAFGIVLFLSSGRTTDAATNTVELSGGGHLASDSVQRRNPSEGRAYVAARLDEGLWVKLPQSRVTRVVVADDLAEYRRRVAIAADDPELHYALARWCKQVTSVPLEQQYRYHLRRTIALDPDHSKARAALGYTEHQGQWKPFEEVKREEGMISVAGRWVVPEAETLRRQDDEIDVASKRWAKEINRLRRMISRGNAEAWESLLAITDPLAAPGIAKELADTRAQHAALRDIRRAFVQLLGRFRIPASVESLTRTVLHEPDPVIRDLAVQQLKDFGQASAIATYMPMLRSNEERVVSNAAAALAEFPPQPELALPLVDALVTQHKRVIAPGPGTQVGFGSGGVGGMSTGGKATVVMQPQKNADVLRILKAMESGVDHGYDQSRWKRHFAAKWASYSGDLRRDP